MSNRQSNGKKTPLYSLIILAALAISFYFSGLVPTASQPANTAQPGLSAQQTEALAPGQRDAVYAYLAGHGTLPDYYITKAEARDLGWQGGGLEPYAPGKMIGGDRFGNYEGALPEKAGRSWKEADIGTMGKSSRGAERIVFSNDGLIYYTPDHYESFEKLGEAD